jgi:DNA polymerase
MQNLRKDPLLFDRMGNYVQEPEWLAQYAAHKDPKVNTPRPVWLEFELNMRHLIIPRPGKKFIIADAAQIEPRCLNWLAGNHELLAKIAEGFSYYEAYAATFEGWAGAPGTIKSSLGPEAYTKLKNKCLGLGYGMGWAKYVSYAGVEEKEAREVVAGFRAENPLVVGLWDTLDKGYREAAARVIIPPTAKNTFMVELPSGRSMIYRKVQMEWKPKKGKDGKWTRKLCYTSEIAGRRWELYGGLLTENLVQATARDVFGYHMLKLKEAGHCVIFHVHDEVIVEADLEADPEAIVKIMSVPPPWLPGCPLAAEAKEANHYKK